MKFNFLKFEESDNAEGIAISIDVIRAGTTAYELLKHNPRHLILFKRSVETWEVKRNLEPDRVTLVGETRGKKPKTFDYDNSPTDIKMAKERIYDKVVCFRTSSGTKATIQSLQSPKCDEVIMGSFICADAIVKYLLKKKPSVVSFIVSGSRTDGTDDLSCAQYIADKLMGKTEKPDEYISKARTSKNIAKYGVRKDDIENCLRVEETNYFPLAEIWGDRAKISKKEI